MQLYRSLVMAVVLRPTSVDARLMMSMGKYMTYGDQKLNCIVQSINHDNLLIEYMYRVSVYTFACSNYQDY